MAEPVLYSLNDEPINYTLDFIIESEEVIVPPDTDGIYDYTYDYTYQ